MVESNFAALIGQWANIVLIFIMVIMCLYIIRHFRFFANRLFQKQGNCHQDLAGNYKPTVSILIPMHMEEKVAAGILDCMVKMDYPKNNFQFEVIAINDGSTDATSEIIDEYASKFHYIKAIHRVGNGGNGKPEALNVGLKLASNEIILIFDADYLPPRDCVARLVAPFVDAEVGGVMGRVVPINSPESLVSRIMDIERAGGYQIGQQARYNLSLIPQFGGTVGGFRRSVLTSLSGFDETKLAEDTDLTYKLYLSGWKIAYVNAAECYEESVSSWRTREKQLSRWAAGHNQCLFEYFFKTMRSEALTFWQKVDGILLLGAYATPLLILIGWLIGIFTYLDGGPWWASLFPAIIFVFAYNCIGNLAVFTEVGGSLFLDQRRRSIWLLPLMFLDMLGNVWVCSGAFFKAVLLTLHPKKIKKPLNSVQRIMKNQNIDTINLRSKSNNPHWDKTERSGNGLHFYAGVAIEVNEASELEKAAIKKNSRGRH